MLTKDFKKELQKRIPGLDSEPKIDTDKKEISISIGGVEYKANMKNIDSAVEEIVRQYNERKN